MILPNTFFLFDLYLGKYSSADVINFQFATFVCKRTKALVGEDFALNKILFTFILKKYTPSMTNKKKILDFQSFLILRVLELKFKLRLIFPGNRNHYAVKIILRFY